MSALPAGIGPVSVRYAAQIREMLYVQAVDKAAAEQEAARAASEAERKERISPEAVQEVDRVATPAAVTNQTAGKPNVSKPAEATGVAQIVDISA